MYISNFRNISQSIQQNMILSTLCSKMYQMITVKYVKANDGPFMAKSLRNPIKLRSELRNRYTNNNKTKENERAFKKQRNWCAKLVRKTKRNYYQRLRLQLWNVSARDRSVEVRIGFLFTRCLETILCRPYLSIY